VSDLLEFRLLKYIVAVAETANFTRASERLFLAQPTLSQQVIALLHAAHADSELVAQQENDGHQSHDRKECSSSMPVNFAQIGPPVISPSVMHSAEGRTEV